ncbi:MAG: hypothetical protein ACI9KS_001745 [Sulfitobacter sp.]|jgi:hypothetical protein
MGRLPAAVGFAEMGFALNFASTGSENRAMPIKKARAVHTKLTLVAICAPIFLAACQSPMDNPAVTRLIEPEPQILRASDGPPGAHPESCWGRDVSPAVVETVTEQVMIQPAQIADDGKVISPGVYKTETQQRITRERKEQWFETPCPEAMTAEFVSSVQRALAARDLYSGRINGQMDRSTRRAVRRFQVGEDLDSAILSMAGARKLGLIAVPREDLVEG